MRAGTIFKVLLSHTSSVIYNPDFIDTAACNLYSNRAGSGVYGVIHKLADYCVWAVDYFSGSNFSADVAVCTTRNKDGEAVRPQPADVASKLPNELGLYDMSGGVWEWVQGVSEDGSCIQRGGSRLSLNTACRVSNKQRMAPTQKKDTFGLRLAL